MKSIHLLTFLTIALTACSTDPVQSPEVSAPEHHHGKHAQDKSHADHQHAHGDKHAKGDKHAHGDHPHGENAPGDHATMHHRFDDAEKWAEIFDDPKRDAWQKPEELIAALGITQGQTAADIGAGTGYFNPHLAKAVGAEGKVIAVDIEESLVQHMTERAKKDGTPQVEVRRGQPDNPVLKPSETDWILLVDVYHHVDQRVRYFSTLTEVVKPGGKLVIVDFKPGDIPVGPPPEHRIPAKQVIEELGRAGWTQSSSVDLLPYQYALVFTVK